MFKHISLFSKLHVFLVSFQNFRLFTMKESQLNIPHLFRCPISLDLLRDPVTLSTGQTYDRPSIEKWLAAGNHTCPVTMQNLQDASLVPNHTLRHLIEQWLQFGHQFGHEIDTLGFLKHSLESHDGIKLQTLENIQVLCRESSYYKACMVKLGFLPLLLEQAFSTKDFSSSLDNVKLVEQELSCAIELLPFSESKCLNILNKEMEFLSFLNLIEKGSISIKIILCQIIEAIASCPDTKDLCARFGQNNKILEEIVHLVHQTDSESSNAGVRAVLALCSLESNQECLIDKGAVGALITYISAAESHKNNLAPLALAKLEVLVMIERAKEEMINSPNGIMAVVKMVFKVSNHEGSESAVNLLMTICNSSLKAREEAIEAGILTQLLLLLQSQCSGGTKSKVRMLLKLLRSKSATTPNSVQSINVRN